MATSVLLLVTPGSTFMKGGLILLLLSFVLVDFDAAEQNHNFRRSGLYLTKYFCAIALVNDQSALLCFFGAFHSWSRFLLTKRVELVDIT